MGGAILQADALDQAMHLCRAVYDRNAGGRPIRCFVNLGAERAFSGEPLDFLGLPDGLLDLGKIQEYKRGRSLLLDFAAEGVPILNFIWIGKFARETGLTIDPVPMQPIGEGAVYLEGQGRNILRPIQISRRPQPAQDPIIPVKFEGRQGARVELHPPLLRRGQAQDRADQNAGRAAVGHDQHVPPLSALVHLPKHRGGPTCHG